MLHTHTALTITATITRNQLMNKVSCQETHFQHCCTLTHSITQGLKMTFTSSHNLVIMHPFCLVIVQSTNMTITFCLVVVIVHVFLFSYSLVDKSPKTLVNQSYLVIFQSTKTTLEPTHYYSNCSSVSSSDSSSLKLGSGSSCSFWLLHVCNLHMSVHASPFDKQGQLGILHVRTHLHVSSSKTTSGAGGEHIQ